MSITITLEEAQAARAVQAITADYRARLQEIVERAALPHLLPEASAVAHQDLALGVTAGPRKPALARVFKPMGYTCRNESGTFTLRTVQHPGHGA